MRNMEEILEVSNDEYRNHLVTTQELEYFRKNADDNDILTALTCFDNGIVTIAGELLFKINDPILFLEILKKAKFYQDLGYDIDDMVRRFTLVANEEQLIEFLENIQTEWVVEILTSYLGINKIEELDHTIKDKKSTKKQQNQTTKQRRQYNTDMQKLLELCDKYPDERDKIIQALKSGIALKEILFKDDNLWLRIKY